MYISENDANRVLDKIEKFSNQYDFLLSIISTLHNKEECDYLINLIDKGKLKSKTQVSSITLLIDKAWKESKGKGKYLDMVDNMFAHH